HAGRARARRDLLPDGAPDRGPLPVGHSHDRVAARLEIDAHGVGEGGVLVAPECDLHPISIACTSPRVSNGVHATSNMPHHDASGPLANTTSASNAALRSLAPSPISTAVCPRYCASLIGACLHTPHDEHGQQ